MPPLPKRRRSKARQGNLGAHRHTALPHLTECPRCHRPMISYRVCPSCGYYHGRDILQVETPVS